MNMGPFENGPLMLAFEKEDSLLALSTADLSVISTHRIGCASGESLLFGNEYGRSIMLIDQADRVLKVVKLVKERIEYHYTQTRKGKPCVIELPI